MDHTANAIVRYRPVHNRRRRGEAMPVQRFFDETTARAVAMATFPEAEPHWYAVWTRSNCEQKVCDALEEKGFQTFLPYLDEWVQRRGVRYMYKRPMFPGYVFLHHAVDKWQYINVCNTPGVVKILGAGWDRLISVPESEIDAIRAIQQAGVPRMPYSYLREGQRVRVTRGALANVTGILVKRDPSRGLLVLSVDLLMQSVAVEVDCTLVVPA
jgi:transcription termination/antitermination protein NusG